MRQNILTRLFLTGSAIFLIVLAIHYGFDEPSHEEVAEQLLSHINGNLPGSTTTTDLKESTVVPLGDNRYLVTFRNSVFKSDWMLITGSIQKNLFQTGNSLRGADGIRIEESVSLFDMKKNISNLQYMKGITMELDPSETAEESWTSDPNGFKWEKVHVSVGKVTFRDFDIKRLQKEGKVDASGKPRNQAEGIRQSFDSKTEDLKIEMTGSSENGETMRILAELDEMESEDTYLEDPDATAFLIDKGARPPDFSKILREGRTINELVTKMGKFSISINKNGKGWGSGSIDNITASYFLKPDDSGAFFKGGLGFGATNTQFTIPGRKNIEVLSRVKQIDFLLSAEHLSPKAVLALLDFLRTSIRMRDVADQSNMQQLLLPVMKLQNEFFKSKGLIKFSISPLKHYFGEMDLKANIRLANLLSMPGVNARIELPEIDKTLEKPRAANVLDSSLMNEISAAMDEHASRKGNGDASIDIAMKPDFPGVVFINGKPQKLGVPGP